MYIASIWGYPGSLHDFVVFKQMVTLTLPVLYESSSQHRPIPIDVSIVVCYSTERAGRTCIYQCHWKCKG